MTQVIKKQNGIKVTVSYNKSVIYADKYNKIGASAHDSATMTIEFNGQKITNNDLGFFAVIDRSVGQNDKLDKSVYARFGEHFIGKATYTLVKSALEEAKEKATESNEYKQTKIADKAQEKRDAVTFEKATKTTTARNNHVGWCEECGSYCYGDCRS